MHPGPVNRGVELSGEVIDSPQSLIAEQVAAGLVVRMAILYELLAGGERPAPLGRGRRRAPSRPRSGSPREPRPRRSTSAPARSADLVLRRATVLDPVAGIDGVHDVVIRDGEIAELAAPGQRPTPTAPRSSRPRACTPSPPSSTPTSTSAPPATSTRRTSRPAPAPPPPAATAGSSRWPTPSRRSRPPPTSRPCASRPASRRLGPGRLPRHRHPRHGGRGADRDGRAARGRRDRLLRRRPADPQRPGDAARAPVPAALRRHDRPARGGPRALRRRRHARGRRSRRRSAWPASPRSRSRR